MEERFAIRIGLVLYVLQVGIEPAKKKRPHLGIRLRFPEAADLGFFEDVVTAQHFVSTFSGYDDLEATVPDESGEKIQGSWSRPQDGFLGMPDHLWKYFGDLILGTAQVFVFSLEKFDCLALEPSFIEFGIVERDGEGSELGVSHFLDQGCGHCRV